MEVAQRMLRRNAGISNRPTSRRFAITGRIGRFYLYTARLLILTLLVVSQVSTSWGQTGPASIMLSEVHVEADAAAHDAAKTTNSMTAYTSAVVPAISLPENPAPQRVGVEVRELDKVLDKKFIAVMAALGGAESLRFTTHKLVLDHEFDAGAPWVTSVPANQHLVTKYGTIYVAELLVAYEIKKPHFWLPGDKVIRKFWLAYPAAMVPIHVKNGVRSIRTQAPSCPVAECESQ